MSGEKKAKDWRFYGLVCLGAIVLLSAGVWALQYAGSGPEKTLSPLVVHNNLQIDLNEPDLFLDSDSLSQLPKDLLTIPFLHDVLSEDFVFYYQNHADRLGIEGSIRRIVYEHDLTLKDKLFSSLLDQPAQAALWHDKQGHLSHYMVLIQRSGLSKLLEPLLFAATSDSQLSKTEISSITQNIGAHESKAPEGVLPVSQTQQGEAQIWRREVSSRYGQYPKAQAAQPDQLMSDYFFRVSLAMQNKTLLFSLDDTLVNNALQTLNKTRPAMVDVIPTDGIVPLYINPQGVAKLLRNETLTSLPKNLEPVFYNAAQTLLMPKLDALSQQPRYVMKLAQMEPGAAWQWLPITWQPL